MPYCLFREQGWRSGESARLPPAWPGFDSRSRRYMSGVKFVVGCCPCSEGFSPGAPVFLPPQKPTFPNSNSTWKQWSKSHSVDSIEIPVYLFILFCLFIVTSETSTLHLQVLLIMLCKVV